MSISDIIVSLLELAAVVFVVWGLFNEDRIAAFEEKLFARIKRRRFKVIKGDKNPNRPRRKER